MSIIYDALKKLEKKRPPSDQLQDGQPDVAAKARKLRPIIIAVAAVLIVTAVAFLSIKGLNGKKGIFSKNKKTLPHKQVPLEVSEAQKGQLSGKKFVLSGIIYSREKSLAIINEKTLAIGETIEGATVSNITEKVVTITFDGEKASLTIQ